MAPGAADARRDEALAIARDVAARHLRHRQPHLAEDHDDLIQTTLMGVASWLARNPIADLTDDGRAHVSRLTVKILKRRIADLFRSRARAWGRTDLGLLGGDRLPGEGPPPDRRVLLGQVLRETVDFLAGTSPDERDLIGAATGDRDGPPVALSDADRKRLQRTRDRLREHLEERFGLSIAEILDDDQR